MHAELSESTMRPTDLARCHDKSVLPDYQEYWNFGNDLHPRFGDTRMPMHLRLVQLCLCKNTVPSSSTMQYRISQQKDSTSNFEPRHDRTPERQHPIFGCLSPAASQCFDVTSISSTVSRMVNYGTPPAPNELGLPTSIMTLIDLGFG
jgi:hypothetical protein